MSHMDFKSGFKSKTQIAFTLPMMGYLVQFWYRGWGARLVLPQLDMPDCFDSPKEALPPLRVDGGNQQAGKGWGRNWGLYVNFIIKKI